MNERHFPCEYCDTALPLQARRVTLTLQRNGRWYIFENVPAEVCPNCGHRYYDGPTLVQLERLIEEQADQLRPVEAWAFSLPVEAL